MSISSRIHSIDSNIRNMILRNSTEIAEYQIIDEVDINLDPQLRTISMREEDLRRVMNSPPKTVMQTAIEDSDVEAVKGMLFKQEILPHDFELLSIKYPNIALRALELYPVLGKSVPDTLLIKLMANDDAMPLVLAILAPEDQKIDRDEDVTVAAIRHGRLEVAVKLIDTKVKELQFIRSVEARLVGFSKSLLTAIEHSHVVIVQKLLSVGANPYDNNCAAFKLAKKTGNKAILEVLQPYELSRALDSGNAVDVKRLLTRRAPPTVEECWILWQRHYDLALQFVGKANNLCKHFPLWVIDRLLEEKNEKASYLLPHLTPDELGCVCVKYPEVIAHHVAALRHVAAFKNCSSLVFDRLLQLESTDDVKLLIEELISVHANVHPRHLHLCVARGYTKAAVKLIDVGVDVKAPDDKGRSVLHAAVRCGQQEVVRKIVAKGADVFACNEKKQTARQVAVELGFTEIANFLSIAEFQFAVENKMEDKIEEMIEAKIALPADVFHNLCIGDEKEFEIAKRIAPWHAEHIKEFPSDILFRIGEATFLRVLELGVPITDVRDAANDTLLINALLIDAEKVALKLIELGVDVSVRGSGGLTPLDMAIKIENPVLIEALISAGADIFGYAKSVIGKTTYTSYLIQKKKDKLAQLFLKTISPVSAAVIESTGIIGGVVGVRLALVENPLLARSCVGKTSTPLEIALILGNKDIAKLIFSQISYEQYLHGIEILCEKFPKSIHSIVDLFFEMNAGIVWDSIESFSKPSEVMAHCDTASTEAASQFLLFVKQHIKPRIVPDGYKEQKETVKTLQNALIKQILKPTGKIAAIKQELQNALGQLGIKLDPNVAPLAQLKAKKEQAKANWYQDEKTKKIRTIALILVFMKQKVFNIVK